MIPQKKSKKHLELAKTFFVLERNCTRVLAFEQTVNSLTKKTKNTEIVAQKKYSKV